MVKLFLILAAFIFLYLGFVFLDQNNAPLFLNFYDYTLETTVFIAFAIYIFSVIFINIIAKLLSLIINIPTTVKKFLLHRKTLSSNTDLLNSMADLVMNKSISQKSLKDLANKLPDQSLKFYYLLKAESSISNEEKIRYYSKIERVNAFSPYVAKKLAGLYYENQMLPKAQDYAIKVYNYNENDSDILELLMNCYGIQSLWQKFDYIVNRLRISDKVKLDNIKDQIADYYFIAAKQMLSEENNNSAISYLQSATQLAKSHYNSLNLYLSLNLIKEKDKIKIMNHGFADRPSFDLAKLYSKFTKLSAKAIYDNLCQLVDVQSNLTLFISIAHYLNLKDEANQLIQKYLCDANSSSN